MTALATFSSPARIIEYAMKDAGLLQRGDLPDSDQLMEYSNRLLDVINMWQTQGLKLWLQQDLSITLVASTSQYTLGLAGTTVMAKPLRITQAYHQSSDGVNTQIGIISRDEWTRLSNRTQEGMINSLFVDKQASLLKLNTWLTPDATTAAGTLHVIAQYQATNFTGLTDTLDFPPEWFIALRWGLADDICTGQPSSIMNRCAARAKMYRDALEDWDVEDASTQFQRDVHGGHYGSFR